MGRYSLINVSREHDNMVDGMWIQDYTGSIDEAIQLARETETANSNRITVAVVKNTNNSYTYPCIKYSSSIADIG